MSFEKVGKELEKLLEQQVDAGTLQIIEEKIKGILDNRSTKELFLLYSLLGSKLSSSQKIQIGGTLSEVESYLRSQNANVLQLGRVYLLVRVLETDKEFFFPKVSNIMEVADTGELETFLKFLVLLPSPEDYRNVAVDALRTNIATVFDAIALNNPFPGRYFNDAQWNQMYLKAAFMQRELSLIMDVDKRANRDLVRIISDYAHERWAASREVDPYFWRPVGPFLEGALIRDMARLLQSGDKAENRAGALCCAASQNKEALELLAQYPELKMEVAQNLINWNNLKL